MEKNMETKWYFLKEKEEWFGTAVNNERIFTAYYITIQKIFILILNLVNNLNKKINTFFHNYDVFVSVDKKKLAP